LRWELVGGSQFLTINLNLLAIAQTKNYLYAVKIGFSNSQKTPVSAGSFSTLSHANVYIR